LYTIRRHHVEAAALRQRRRVVRAALGQVGFIHGQLSGLDLQAIEGDRVIRRIDWRWWRKRIQCPTVVAVDVPLAQVKVGQLGDTVETCRRETDGRGNAPCHLGQHYETVPAAQRACHAAGVTTRRSGLGVLGRVGARSDGLLQALDITELRLTRLQVGGMHMGA
jgi:hypothetical protein